MKDLTPFGPGREAFAALRQAKVKVEVKVEVKYFELDLHVLHFKSLKTQDLRLKISSSILLY